MAVWGAINHLFWIKCQRKWRFCSGIGLLIHPRIAHHHDRCGATGDIARVMWRGISIRISARLRAFITSIFKFLKSRFSKKNVADKKGERPAFLERVKDKILARSLFALLVQLLGENPMWSQAARKCEYVIIRRGNSPITLKLHRPFNLRKNAPQDVLRAA